MMKKIPQLIFILVMLISCSKEVTFKGEITGVSPLERIEFIEASGVATLPLINVGINAEGAFNGAFEAPRDGMYLMTYGGNQKLIYIEKGQNLIISGDAHEGDIQCTGEGKSNNVFLDKIQEETLQYANQFNIEEKMKLPQKEFISALQKVHQDLEKKVNKLAKEHKASVGVVRWKQNDIKVGLLNIVFNYKDTKKEELLPEFIAFEKELKSNEDELIENFPSYRSYLLNELTDEFDAYFQANGKGKVNVSFSEVFVEFLNKKKNLSPMAKDYLIAFVMAQMDITQQAETQKIEKLKGIINKNIKKTSIKEDLNKVIKSISGLKVGEKAPNSTLILPTDKKMKVSEFSGKPTVLFFYSSWTPNLVQEVETLSEFITFYQEEINFVAINFDDSMEQFKKTSKAVMRGLPVQNAYANLGLQSDFAKDYYIYGFKLKPTYIILDKEGKIASSFLFHVRDERMTEILNQLSGLEFTASGTTLQNDLLQPQENSTNE